MWYGLSESLELYSISISPFCFSFIQIIPQSAVYTGHIIIGCCTSVCSWFICSQVFYHSFSKISSWIDSFLLSHEKVLYIWGYWSGPIWHPISYTIHSACAVCIVVYIYTHIRQVDELIKHTHANIYSEASLIYIIGPSSGIVLLYSAIQHRICD
jgi:hypothetical protein